MHTRMCYKSGSQQAAELQVTPHVQCNDHSIRYPLYTVIFCYLLGASRQPK